MPQTIKTDLDRFQDEYAEKMAAFRNYKAPTREVKFEMEAKFYKDEKTGNVMLSARTDPKSEFVRKATDADKKQYPDAWKAFVGLKPRKD